MYGWILVAATACGSSDGGNAPPSPTPAPTATPAPSGAPLPTPEPEVGAVTFSPRIVRLDNPTRAGESRAEASFTVRVAAWDAAGEPIAPSADNPIRIAVHGAPRGAISPDVATLDSGSEVTFVYDGSYFADPMTLVAWIDHPAQQADRVAQASAGRKSLGRTQIMHANLVDCAYGSTSYSLPLDCQSKGVDCASTTMTDGLKLQAAVGTSDATAGFATFTLDTGSLGFIVPASELGPEAIGPGASGVKFYDSSGNTYAGNYWLAPVSFRLGDGSVVTSAPIQVLGITSAYCAPGYPKCDANPPSPTLHYLGVGFDRNATAADDDFDSPADNVFLHVGTGADANEVSPGYVLTTSEVTLGITSTSGYGTVPLTPSTAVAGDWNSAAGCFGFPEVAQPNQFCGTMLLDVGIDGMFLDLEKAQRPAGTEDDRTSPPTVPEGTRMQIVASTADAPAASYEYTLSSSPSGPGPVKVTWIDSSQVFVNTGRRPLLAFDYLYDARCGNVGFKPLE